MKKNVCALLFIISLILSSALCYAGIDAEHSNYIKILEIQPNPSIPLVTGSNVHFEVKVEFYVKEESASIDVVVQKGEHSESSSAFIGSVKEIVTQGKGVATLAIDVMVPDTKAIEIFTPLTVSGQQRTTTVDAKFYKVVK